MGINGLLVALKPIAKQVHVRHYQGQRVAVDGYSWLHKGAYCCARELCEGLWTDKFVVYFMSRIQLLRTNGVEPIVVFDGGRLPIKGEEESSRHRARAEARDKAAAYLAAGNVAMAQECYQRCVDITPAMAKQVIEELKSQGVAFLVAPYEADAQMAYLARSGAVQVVVTEDSDLLAYGCPRVLYKLDKTGTGEEMCLADLPNCPGLPMSGWTADQFLQLCVMAGCDFLAQMPGIGLKKAHGVLRKYRTFTKVVKMLRFNGTKVPPDYETRFQLALWAFRHARVYCTTEKAMIHLAPLPGGGIGAADVDVPAAVAMLEQQQQDTRLDFLGPLLSPEVARGIAEGELDPNTHQPYDLAAIYAGCSRPPAHLAAQLAQQQPAAADPGDVDQPFSGSQAAAGKPRVGLSRRHASQSGGGARRMSGAAGVSGGGRNSGGRQSAGGAAGGGTKRASLGIAKYFQQPAAAPGSSQAPPAAGIHRAASAPAVTAGPPPAAVPAGPSGIRQSVTDAITALGQRLQQRKQQQQAEQEERQRQQAEAEAQQDNTGVPDQAFGLPPAKRHRSCGDVAAAAAAAADSEGFGGASSSQQQGSLQGPGSSLEPSQPDTSGSLGLLGRSQSQPALADSMSLGLGSAGGLAGSSADMLPSQAEAGAGLGSDPGLLYGSLDALGSQQPRGRGAAVSALTALFGPAGGFGRGASASQSGADPAGSWDGLLSGGSGAVPGGYFSQPELGSSGSDMGASIDGCGSSSGLSWGALGCSSGGGDAGAGAGAAAVLDGTASVSFGLASRQGCDPDTPTTAAGSHSFRHLQQALRAGLKKPAQQQQQAAPAAPSRSSFFSQQQQQQQQQPASTATRRHSRFRQQWLEEDLADGGANKQSPVSLDLAADAADAGVSLLQGSQDELPGQLRPGGGPPGDDEGGALWGTAQRPPQQQRPQACAQLSDSSDPSSSGTTSNDENTDGGGALQQLGILHVKQYAKLAHKVVKSVAKQQQHHEQQQQQHAPLAPRMGLLNTQQAQLQPGGSQQQQRQRQGMAAGHDGGSAADAAAAAGALTSNRTRLKLGGSTGGLPRGKAAKASAAGVGSFAAKLSALRYDASMFVSLDEHQQQRQQREQEEQQGAFASLQGEAGPVARQAGMFGRGAGAAAAARKPFKAPWQGAGTVGAGAPSAESPSLSDVLTGKPAAGAGEGGFGAFADFAMSDDSSGGAAAAIKRAGGLQRRGVKVGLR